MIAEKQDQSRTGIIVDFHHRQKALSADVLLREMQRLHVHTREPCIDTFHGFQVLRPRGENVNKDASTEVRNVHDQHRDDRRRDPRAAFTVFDGKIGCLTGLYEPAPCRSVVVEPEGR